MANIKFSQFTQKTTLGTVDFLVGYTGADNVQISPTNLLSDYPTGSGATGRVAFWEPSNNLSSDYLFKWDNSNNRLGIGVEHPATTLHAVTADDTIAKFESSDNKAAISISDDDTTGYFSAENGRIGFGTGLGASSSNISILTSNSNVGIGTVSPSAKLEVDGTFISTGISQLGSSGSNVLLTSSSAGNVGIGTSSPSNKLVVNGTVHLGSNGSDVTIGASNSSVIFMLRSGYNYIQASDASGALMFRTGGNNNRMIIDSSGNVGIGTTSPSSKLHVNGVGYFEGGTSPDFGSGAVNNAGVIIEEGDYIYTKDGTSLRKLIGKASDIIQIGEGSTSLIDEIRFKPGNNGFTSFYDDNTETARFTDGKLGIGTSSPANKLDVNGIIAVNQTAGGNAGIKIITRNDAEAFLIMGDPDDNSMAGIAYNNSTNTLSIDSNNAERISIDSSGNVGIGSTSPTSKLTVAVGDIETSGVGYGLILKSPNGTRYRVTVDNSGNLSTTAV